ncbi:hypothetical protein CNMCM6106_002120 [Aspergillus hiratsukae]|uniref:Uncharacterized protein n=1 Tax=Aspergillus hiratsukae TaxID=1194566 RepID=A0A8H6Q482_9EURO|nr:hypothetical protein CNMCM6106_002120 [Aspergillus hiratsukae]
MSEVEFKIKLTGFGRLVVGRLVRLLEDYTIKSPDPEVNLGQRSVELELEITDEREGYRVIKKQKAEVGSHEGMINFVCERCHAILAHYFQFDPKHDDPITLTLKVIFRSSTMNTDAPARTYMELYEKVDDY